MEVRVRNGGTAKELLEEVKLALIRRDQYVDSSHVTFLLIWPMNDIVNPATNNCWNSLSEMPQSKHEDILALVDNIDRLPNAFAIWPGEET